MVHASLRGISAGGRDGGDLRSGGAGEHDAVAPRWRSCAAGWQASNHYGETGYQAGHTSRGVDLELIAKGSGIATTHTVSAEAAYAAAAQSLRASNGPSFVWLRVSTERPPTYKRNFDAVERKVIFRRALLGNG